MSGYISWTKSIPSKDFLAYFDKTIFCDKKNEGKNHKYVDITYLNTSWEVAESSIIRRTRVPVSSLHR